MRRRIETMERTGIVNATGIATLRLVAALAGQAAVGLAHAETINCDGAGGAGSGAGRISSVPYTISAPGVYCLTQKISSNLASGAAITINANNVMLDLNSFAIGNLAAGPTTTAIGIYAVDRQNIVIQNGILRGFWAGIGLVDGTLGVSGGTTANSSGHTVKGITCDTSYVAGIVVQGPYASIRGNTVINTAGSHLPGALAPGIGTPNIGIGIAMIASNSSEISGNSVIDTDCTNACAAPAAARGVMVLSSQGVHVARNVLSNGAVPAAANPIAISVGAFNGNGIASTDAQLTRNSMFNWAVGISFDQTAPVSTGVFWLNQALGVSNPYASGTNVPSGGVNFSY